jgi:transcriptional regulator with XRE-family HTH domain
MQQLKKLRLDENMTQQELAAATGLTQSTLSRLENGRRRPHPKTLQRLAEVLGVKPEELDPNFAVADKPGPVGQMPDKVARPLLSLVNALARKYARWAGERDELRSAGQEGLWEAWSKFDPDRGVPFEKFAGPRIKWRVLDKVRQLNRDKTSKAYGFETTPRWVREFMGFGGSDGKENRQEE